MKTMKKFLSMAALAMVGVVMTGCSNNDDSIDTPQQPENNIVTLTATIGFEGNAGTRALASNGTKTFAAGDKIAVIYKNSSDQTQKAEGTITSGVGEHSATFTVTLTNPDNTKAIRYIYPAAMAIGTIATDASIDDEGTVDFTKLLNNQDGTLTKLGSTFDLCTLDAANWTSGVLPSGTLSNQLAILAINLKCSSDITSSITYMTVSDGSNTYTVRRSAVAGPIYVAMKPVTTNTSLTITANDGVNYYTKDNVPARTYNANKLYPFTWNMTQVTPPVNN